jgi:D-arabinose 1-dehydrogenase-like Zn-dependent alcohol dehydrogenase
MVGFSMYPTVGPLAIGLCRDETIKEGDIIAFRYMNHSITHRVISIQGNTIVTKGDHNDFYEVIDRKDVKCKVVWYLSLIPPESVEKLYKKMGGK